MIGSEIRLTMADKIFHNNIDIDYFLELYPDLLCIVDDKGFLKKINPAVPKLLGYSDEELYSSPIDQFIHPQDRSVDKVRMKRQMAGEFIKEYVNRYITKDGRTVWLAWTSVFVERDQLLFAIAKDITGTRLMEKQEHFSAILDRLGEEQRKRFSQEVSLVMPFVHEKKNDISWLKLDTKIPVSDRVWLRKFESLIRSQAPKFELHLKLLSSEMAMTERQLYRQVKRLVGLTPKALIWRIRFHIVWENIAADSDCTLTDLARLAGFANIKKFKTSFHENFGIEVTELLY